ncbi:hypothetical protein AB0907_37745 [Streptomyces sp. NPDC006975]|uniref:hypothetical protein n=1 Tax=Streptomyces sp. NPDC006975 TaxID=3154310 RepID=UPI003454B03E
MPEHHRKSPVRRAQEPRVAIHHASLQAIRDALPPHPDARTVTPTGAVAHDTVPPAFLAMVEEYARWVNKHWAQAAQAGRQYDQCAGEWQRLVLYHLTDALTYNILAVDTLAAHLLQQGTDKDLVRRYVQSPDPDRYVTQHALEHLAGLLDP